MHTWLPDAQQSAVPHIRVALRVLLNVALYAFSALNTSSTFRSTTPCGRQLFTVRRAVRDRARLPLLQQRNYKRMLVLSIEHMGFTSLAIDWGPSV